MAVRVVFLGRLRDVAGTESLDLPGPLDWPTLLAALPRGFAEHLGTMHVACGGTVLADPTRLAAQDGDEVALLPPVSGG
jgi:molybdopterin synthase sulfur carrier subunit